MCEIWHAHPLKLLRTKKQLFWNLIALKRISDSISTTVTFAKFLLFLTYFRFFFKSCEIVSVKIITISWCCKNFYTLQDKFGCTYLWFVEWRVGSRLRDHSLQCRRSGLHLIYLHSLYEGRGHGWGEKPDLVMHDRLLEPSCTGGRDWKLDRREKI